MRPMTPPRDGARLDLDAADLRISRGSVPASAQLAEALKAQIIQPRRPRGRHSPDKELRSPEVRAPWGGKTGRPLPWHSLGEAYLGERWVKLDATIDAPTAALGKPYRQEFDGVSDIPTVEGPIIRENGSYADYPAEVAHWYERIAQSVLKALKSDEIHAEVAGDDDLWAGPPLDLVARTSVV